MIASFKPLKQFIVLLSILLLAQAGFAGNRNRAIFQIEQHPLTTNEFFISGVEDHRANKKIPHIMSLSDSRQIKAIPLEGAGFAQIQQALIGSLIQNKKFRPVIIRVWEAKIFESVDGNRVSGKIFIKLSFHLNKSGKAVDLVEYDGEAHYARSLNNKGVPAAALIQALTGGMKFFISWMNRESVRNPILARGVQFHFKEHLVHDEDTVYYTPIRPLTWADFKDTPRNNQFGAEVFAGFGFDQYSKMQNGIVNVFITTKVFVPKSGSWVRADNRNGYALNHEQRHFDLAKIVAERFKQGVLQANLNLDNYEGFLGPHYFETLRQMNRLQDQYDTETRHGLDRGMQEFWDKKIDADLVTYGVKTVKEL